MTHDDWQPIETAPDMTAVLIYGSCEIDGTPWPPCIVIAYRCSGRWEDGGEEIADYQPTHWRPLPPPPQDIPSTTGKNVTS